MSIFLLNLLIFFHSWTHAFSVKDSGFLGGQKPVPGGLGDKVNQWWNRNTLADSLLAMLQIFPSPTIKLSIINKSQSINIQQFKLNTIQSNQLRFHPFTFTLFTFLILVTACSTTFPRSEKIEVVPIVETKLLQEVRVAREVKKLSLKIRANGDIAQAKIHLKVAHEMQVLGAEFIKTFDNKKQKSEGQL